MKYVLVAATSNPYSSITKFSIEVTNSSQNSKKFRSGIFGMCFRASFYQSIFLLQNFLLKLENYWTISKNFDEELFKYAFVLLNFRRKVNIF